jgi:VanZ family protein
VSHRLLILVALFVVVATLLFMQLPVPPTYAGRTIENAGHMPVFFLVTIGLLVVLRNDFRFEGARLYALAGLIGAGLGFISEVIQEPLARDASWEDVFSDAVGAVCALAVYALFDRRSRLTRTTWLAALGVALACLVFYFTPLVRMTVAYVQRNAQFPVLADFRSPMAQLWMVGYGTDSSLGADALEVVFARGRWPGVSLREPVPDWTAYRTLLIDVENPDTVKLGLTVRVHDRGHWRDYSDRFNRHFELGAGERRTLRIDLGEVARAPKGRLMDLRQVADITLLRDTKAGSRRLRIYTMQLE